MDVLAARCRCALGAAQAGPILMRVIGSWLQPEQIKKSPADGGAYGLRVTNQPSSLAGLASPSLSSASMIMTAAGLFAANLTRPSR